MTEVEPTGRGQRDLAAQLDRFRLESDTLYRIIAFVASTPDLPRVLSGVVDLLTAATRCHACFVYLAVEDRLRLRAASAPYEHLAGRIHFSVEEGLAGWALRNNTPGLIRERAIEDPRTNYIAELEEEQFQSMAAVPITSRVGAPIGVIVLHTVAPREFDERSVNLLVHTAPLVAGAIENAKLYEDAQHRVETLTALSELSQRIAAVSDRAALYSVAISGVSALLECADARLYDIDEERHDAHLVASTRGDEIHGSGGRAVVRLTAGGDAVDAVRSALHAEFGDEAILAVAVATGGRTTGVLAGCGVPERSRADDDLLAAVANQVAVALERADLVERLTEENLMRDLLVAAQSGRTADVEDRAQRAQLDLGRPFVVLHLRPCWDAAAPRWAELTDRLEAQLRRLVPSTFCDVGNDRLRALVTLTDGCTDSVLRRLDASLAQLGTTDALAVGRSDMHHGAQQVRHALREASDASDVACALHRDGGMLSYGELGAYRYLVHFSPEDAARDPYLEAVATIARYDARRGAHLVATLEHYLAERRGVAEAARRLIVHPNTLRQRLERIEQLTGLDLATVDLLSLGLAIKLSRLRVDP